MPLDLRPTAGHLHILKGDVDALTELSGRVRDTGYSTHMITAEAEGVGVNAPDARGLAARAADSHAAAVRLLAAALTELDNATHYHARLVNLVEEARSR